VGFFDFGAAVDVDRRQSAFLAKITDSNIAIIIRVLIKQSPHFVAKMPNLYTNIACCTHLALIWEFMASTQGSATWNTFLMDGLRWPASNAIKTLARLNSSRFGRSNRSHVDKSAPVTYVTWYFYVMGYKLKSRDELSPSTMPLARARSNIGGKMIIISGNKDWLWSQNYDWLREWVSDIILSAADGLKAAADYRRCNCGALLISQAGARAFISRVLSLNERHDHLSAE
jgi:hypothetical protein